LSSLKIEISDGKVQVAYGCLGGRLSYEDVLDQLATQPKDDTPMTQATIDRLAGHPRRESRAKADRSAVPRSVRTEAGTAAED
jgi:hypothetical protein